MKINDFSWTHQRAEVKAPLRPPSLQRQVSRVTAKAVCRTPGLQSYRPPNLLWISPPGTLPGLNEAKDNPFLALAWDGDSHRCEIYLEHSPQQTEFALQRKGLSPWGKTVFQPVPRFSLSHLRGGEEQINNCEGAQAPETDIWSQTVEQFPPCHLLNTPTGLLQ